MAPIVWKRLTGESIN